MAQGGASARWGGGGGGARRCREETGTAKLGGAGDVAVAGGAWPRRRAGERVRSNNGGDATRLGSAQAWDLAVA